MKREDLKIGMPIYEHPQQLGIRDGMFVGNITEINEDNIVLDTGVKFAIKMDRQELYVSGKRDHICLERCR